MWLDGARHVHDAIDGDLVVVSVRHLYLRPTLVDVRHTPDAVLQSRFLRTPLHLQIGQREHETNALVLVHEESVSVEREDVVYDQFVLVAGERDGEVPVRQHHPAGVRPVVDDLSVVQRVVWRYRHFRCNIRQQPVEITALEPLLQVEPRRQRCLLVGRVRGLAPGVDQRRRVEVPPIVSQPQVGDPHEVFLPLLLPAGPVAIGQWPKEVADSRARHRYDRPATEPGTKGELQVLAAPDLLIRVEAADVQEVRPVYGDSAADQRRRPERPAFGQCRLLDVVRHLDPNVPKTHRAKLGALSAWRLLLRTTAFVVRLR